MATQPLYQPNVSPTGQVAAYVPPGQTYVPSVQNPLPTASTLPFLSPGSINIQGESKFPSFTFDFAQEQATAYNQLKPFYEKILAFAGGDLDLAKRIIDYTYQQGMRETSAERSETMRGFDLTDPVEKSQLQTNQNRRGILSSGFGNTERERLRMTQDLRREAAERALADRENRLGSERGFGLEEKQRGFEKSSFDLERERRNEASGMAQDKFGIKQAEYQGNLAKSQREEERRVAKKNMDFQKKLYEQQGYKV